MAFALGELARIWSAREPYRDKSTNQIIMLEQCKQMISRTNVISTKAVFHDERIIVKKGQRGYNLVLISCELMFSNLIVCLSSPLVIPVPLIFQHDTVSG